MTRARPGGYHRQTAKVVLSCRHEKEFSLSAMPLVGEDVYCYKCTRYRMVEIIPTAYRVRCQNCKLGRRVGLDLNDAKMLASKHVVTNNTHTVDIFKGEERITTVSLDDKQGELPFDSVIAERLVANKPHQNNLRKIYDRRLDRKPDAA